MIEMSPMRSWTRVGRRDESARPHRRAGARPVRSSVDRNHSMDYRAVLTAALHTQAYSEHWGTRCDVFDIPGMDKRAYLGPSSDATLAFHVVPADTLSLARVFYRRTKAVAGVRRLARDPEWGVKHAFHFGFTSTGYAWATGNIDIDRYLDLWVAAIETAGAVDRADWDRYIAWLVFRRSHLFRIGRFSGIPSTGGGLRALPRTADTPENPPTARPNTPENSSYPVSLGHQPPRAFAASASPLEKSK